MPPVPPDAQSVQALKDVLDQWRLARSLQRQVECIICETETIDVVYLHSHSQTVCFDCLLNCRVSDDATVESQDMPCCRHSLEDWIVQEAGRSRICDLCDQRIHQGSSVLHCPKCPRGGFDVCGNCAVQRMEGQKTLERLFFEKKPQKCPWCRGRLEVSTGHEDVSLSFCCAVESMSTLQDALDHLRHASSLKRQASCSVECAICITESTDTLYLRSHSQTVCCDCLISCRVSDDVAIRGGQEIPCCRHSLEDWIVRVAGRGKVCDLCEEKIDESSSVLHCPKCPSGGFDVCGNCAVQRMDGQKTLERLLFEMKPRKCPWCRGRLEVSTGPEDAAHSFLCVAIEEVTD